MIESLRNRNAQRSKYLVAVAMIGLLAVVLQGRWVRGNRDRVYGGSIVHMLAGLRQERVIRVGCDHCGRTGAVQRDGVPQPCSVCFGLGFANVLVDPATEMICGACRGMGRTAADTGPAVPCPECGGRGVLSEPDPYRRLGGDLHLLKIECEYGQRGRYRNPATGITGVCPICQGLHYREVRLFHPDDGLCPACGGMGRVFDADGEHPRSCQRCGGRGLIRSGGE